MVECGNCGRKFGFLEGKYSWYDEDGNTIKYCEECNTKCKEKENKERLSKITPILTKYFEKCDVMKKVAMGRLYSDEDIFKHFKKESTEEVENYLAETYVSIENIINSGEYDDLDAYMNLKELCSISFDILEDLKKMFKIFSKKEIDTDYIEMIEIFHNFVEQTIEDENNSTVNPEYKRISNKLKKNLSVRAILKEFVKTPLNVDIDVDISKMLLDKFEIEYEEDEIESILNDVKEEVELEDFEENLGDSKPKSVISDYTKLNGFQFESYLKTLFEALDYVVVQTKLSGDQGADLIIRKEGNMIAVQAKKYAGSVSNKAIQEAVAAMNHYKCDSAMVVTTGKFTKGAIQLGISNKVELWDKTKLDKVIAEINNSTNTSIYTSHGVSLEKGSYPICCPYCNSDISIAFEDTPPIGEKNGLECPECDMNLTIQIPEEYYTCDGCKNEFDTVKERMQHNKKCKKWKERQYVCKHCKVEITLDDDEFEELKNKKKLNAECPDCKKNTKLTRSTL